jgi:hypothetical protein
MNYLRQYWQDIGGIVGVGICVVLFFQYQHMQELQVILWLSFVAILFHQFEEYRWPGYFAGLFNIVIFKSANPDKYPLNSQSAMVINILIAYGFYFLPIFFIDQVWMGLAPIFMGFFQFIWHGVFANLKIKKIYNPGLLAVVLLHMPIGGWYINYITVHNLATSYDWILGIAYFVVATYVLIVKGNMWMKDEKSIYSFTQKQLGPYRSR